MKLIRLHINNFGTLSDFNLNFNDGLNTILENNGWGKTTLAVFIKVMLYGFDSTNSRDIEKSERLKYLPWNGGVFGGTLEFSVQENSYRIERTFGKKEKDDQCVIYDLQSNKQTDIFADSPGLKLFSVDSGAFEKSVFIPQKEFDFDFGENLRSELANLFGNLDDTQDVGNAISKIDEAEKAISKKKGGKLSELNDKLKDLEITILNKEKDIKSLAEIEDNKENLKKSQEEFEKEKDTVAEKLKLIEKSARFKAKKENADTMKSQIESRKNELKDKEEKLNNHDPSDIKLQFVQNQNTDLIGLKAKVELKKKGIDNLDEYKKLKDLFIEKPLTKNDINEIEEKIALYDSLKVKENAPIIEKPAGKRKIPKLALAIMIISIIVMISGLGLFALSLIAGIIPSLIGVVLLVVSVLLIVLKNNNNSSANIAPIDNNIEERNKIENELKEFFNKYNLYEMNFRNNLTILLNRYKRYEELDKNYVINQEEVEDLNKQIDEKTKIITDELDKYNLTSPTFETKIHELSELKIETSKLKEDVAHLEHDYQKFIKDNSLDEELPNVENIDAEQLNNEQKEIQIKIDQIKEEIFEKDNTLLNLRESEETIKDDKLEKIELEETIKQYKHRDKILKATREFIAKTDEAVKIAYVKPMSDKVKYYLDSLIKNENLSFNIDTDFKFNGIENEIQRDIKYYSKGFKEAIAICLRLALIDCLFKDEKPFLLLDDPFTNLDDAKLFDAKKLLKVLSENKQILYLTCHKSRKID